MDWLEKESKRRREIVMSWSICPGDFVNLSTWFGDVWAEVKEYCGTFLVIYRHNGKYVTEMVDISNVRKLCRKENISKIKTCRIITSERIIKATYPMDPNAYCFQGDEHIELL
jgi:hypothetical protein